MDFKAKYNQTNFISFFRDSLLPEDFTPETETISLDFKSNHFKEVTYLGGSPSLDLSVYEIRHSSEKDARVGLSRDAFKLISRYSPNNALILFVPDNPSNFRLSLVTIEPKLDEKGVKVLKEYSNPRRYSFVLGEDAKTHTPEQYLIAMGRIADSADLKKRFSVEVVNKEFYGQIAAMFSQLVGGKRRKGSKTVEFERSLILPSVAAENEQKYKEFAVRLIGRTVFCWFLKKKKSGNDIPLIDDEVLSLNASKEVSNFYHARVEPLFFEILNTPLEKRKPEYQKLPFNTIPFLNGGLFEPHTDDFYLNGQPNYALKIPDQWWKDFLDILETYNFTIDENTSIDIDLSVDPEMLGRIFENLLAEINPETGETARKATGSYYTPRPIVEYMVDQSLKQYLITKTGIEEAKFDTLLDYSNESSGLTTEEEKRVIEALNTIKILDPACGSGAFPMGMLQKMLLILQKVDHEATNSILQVLNEINDPTYREIIKQKLDAAKVFDSDNLSNYARKLSVIQRSIYGVDIQPVAIDISKLRFFLSLVVDEVIQDDKPNRGVEALPNLEFKFVCANTLIPLPEPDNFERMFGDAELVNGLEEIRNRYFTATNTDKPKLKQLFESLQTKLYLFLTKNKGVLMNPNGRLQLLSVWKPFAEETTPWFDPKWMFGVDNGFDVVIGNPPYVQLQKEGGKLANMLKPYNFKTFERTGDIYAIFYEVGFNLLKNSGVHTFITSSQWMKAGYGKSLRKLFLTKEPLKLIALGPGIFDSATVDTNILIAKNAQNSKVLEGFVIENANQVSNLNKLKFAPMPYISDDAWVISGRVNQSLNNKITAKGKALQEWKLAVYRGVLTGFNEAFIIDFNKKEDLIHKESKSSEIIKPVLRGREIEKYHTQWDGSYLINTHNGHKKGGISPININDYNVIKKHLEEFGDKLSNRQDQGDTPYNLRNCSYLYEFQKEKIVWKRIGSQLRFTYFEDEMYCLDSTCIATGEKIKYLTGLLNSKLCNYQLFESAPRTGMGDLIISVQAIEPLHVYYPTDIEENLIVKKVDAIIAAKKHKQPTPHLETQIDLMVYKLYELTYDEVKVVDPEIERIISREDYERMGVEELGDYKIEI
jgi:type I restriction-modification system DNA methylase subunit